MKTSIVALVLAIFGTADAGKYPSVSVTIKDGSYGALDAIDPEVSYSTGVSALGCDFQAGATSSVKPTLDVLSLPRSLWGKISTDVAGWSLSSRVGLNLVDDNNAAIDLAASNDDLDTSIKVGKLNNLEVEKGFDLLGGRFAIVPRYNIASSQADVTLAYDSDSTTVTIDASSDAQKLTVSQQITDGHRLTPSITSSGDFSVARKKDLGNGDSLTTTLTPGDNVNIKWEDGPWTAEFATNLDGYKTEGLNVRVHRKVTFI